MPPPSKRAEASRSTSGGSGYGGPISLISHTRIDSRVLSTGFQFNELIGPGVRFGGRGQFEIALRVQHTSNDGIREPNNGLTYRTLVFQYAFQ